MHCFALIVDEVPYGILILSAVTLKTAKGIFMKRRKRCAFFVAMILFCSIALASFSCETGSNRLAGTRWESGSGGVLEFGQTSFTLTQNWLVETGTYRINGDAVIFTIRGGEETGSLIGDTLTVWGARFQRAR